MTAVNPFCKYKHIFGAEGEGAHKYRIFNIAIIDTVLTVIGAWIISRLIRKPFWIVFLVVFILGILLHRLFCVKTTVTKMIFGDKY
jgi:hypothetical protein